MSAGDHDDPMNVDPPSGQTSLLSWLFSFVAPREAPPWPGLKENGRPGTNAPPPRQQNPPPFHPNAWAVEFPSNWHGWDEAKDERRFVRSFSGGAPHNNVAARIIHKASNLRVPPDNVSGPSQTRGSRRSSAKKAKKQKKGWKISRKEVPPHARGLQDALHLHARILMRRLTAQSVPTPIPASVKASFEARLSPTDDVGERLNHILSQAVPPANAAFREVTDFLNTARRTQSQISNWAARVAEHHLSAMFNAVSNAGLLSFAPDVFSGLDSLYNLAHEHVFVHSFRAVAALFAYSTIFEVNLALLNDEHLLRRFYRSFVFGHLGEQAGIENRHPGQVAINIVKNNQTRHRDDLKRYRGNQIVDDGFCRAAVKAVAAEPDCHSEDEEDPNTGQRVAHRKPGRDGAVNKFFHALTQRRDTTMARKNRRGAWHPHARSPERLPATNLSRSLPTNVPIDYFSPEFFNDMTVRERASYMNNGIALPTEQH
ncbi:hypothetical protein C8F04DRAFT_1279177 [Mycena alexandri]|uniref:Uncharacterized protein n=1 Tax=Mycena alexandri TaxID=1745969 RepID=A0AAD6RYC6_9AGAR|nr:hypothetical protein C8F04DRAFT_1279177 [Mycena alexandri]